MTQKLNILHDKLLLRSFNCSFWKAVHLISNVFWKTTFYMCPLYVVMFIESFGLLSVTEAERQAGGQRTGDSRRTKPSGQFFFFSTRKRFQSYPGWLTTEQTKTSFKRLSHCLSVNPWWAILPKQQIQEEKSFVPRMLIWLGGIAIGRPQWRTKNAG